MRSFIIFFAVVFVTSCTDFYVGSFDDPQDEKLKAVSIAQIAQDVFERFYGPGTKSSDHAVSSIITLGDSLATAVNFAAGGFVIIRNGDDVLPLVACQQGSFLSEVGDETPQLIVSSILRGLKPNPDFPPDTSYAFIQELVTYQDSLIISPIIDVKWHQEAPFNIFAPNGVAGCAAVGVAQAISVFSYPNSISLTYPEADMLEATLDWSQMKESMHSDLSSFGLHDYLTCDVCLQCARLMRQIGEYCNIHYDINSSSWSSLNDYRVPLSSLGFSSSYADYSIGSVISSLQNGYPVIIKGDNAGGAGHIFNVDGCRQYVKDYTLKVYESGTWRTDSYHSESETYLHLCYGQQFGFFDGYYLARVTNFNQPEGGDPYYYENNTLQGRFWNNNLKITYNIHPLDE